MHPSSSRPEDNWLQAISPFLQCAGRAGVCLTTLGPGATNATTAVAYAHLGELLSSQMPPGSTQHCLLSHVRQCSICQPEHRHDLEQMGNRDKKWPIFPTSCVMLGCALGRILDTNLETVRAALSPRRALASCSGVSAAVHHGAEAHPEV